VIACVSAADPEGDNITYLFPEPSEYFRFSAISEMCIVLTWALDFETLDRHIVEIVATDGVMTSEESTFIAVNVINQNELALVIPDEFSVSIREAFYTTSPILNLSIPEPDPGTRYTFELEKANNFFSITRTGSVHLTTQLDFETQETHTFAVSLSDGSQFATTQVVVNVIPVNEHAPEFQGSQVAEVDIDENVDAGGFEFTLNAVDNDKGSDVRVFYELVYVEDHNITYFEIIQPEEGSTTGTLVNSRQFDYESDPRSFKLEIYANDTLHYSSIPLSVNIFVEDVNDFAPEFQQDNYSFTFPEDQAEIEFQIQAIDKDGTALFNTISYSIENLEPDGVAVPFFLGSSGIIRNTRRFDHESVPNEFQFRYIAQDDYGLSGSTLVTVSVEDANEFFPVFDRGLYDITIPESVKVGTEIVRVRATDRDGGQLYGEVTYAMQSSGTALSELPFTINSTTGGITLTSEMDFDIGQEGGDFFVRATDGGGLSSETRVFVTVEDVNDNPPCPLVKSFTAALVENRPRQDPLRRIQTVDVDYYARNPPVVFYMVPQYEEFSIDRFGRLFVSRLLDHEKQAAYNFVIIASDGLRNCSQHTVITLIVYNVDDNRPEFLSQTYNHSISENTPPTTLFNISAVDADPPDVIKGYRLSSRDQDLPFSVSQTGEVASTRVFDADDPNQPAVYRFEALAFNQYGQNTNSPAQITIIIDDENDNVPRFDQEVFTVTLFENHPPGPNPFLILRAVDRDRSTEFSTLNYTLVATEDSVLLLFAIDSETGAVTLNSSLDYETADQRRFSFNVLD